MTEEKNILYDNEGKEKLKQELHVLKTVEKKRSS